MSVCESVGDLQLSGQWRSNDFALSRPMGAVLRVRVVHGSPVPSPSSLLHVRLRAATLTDVVGLFRRASDRLGDDSRVSISSTGALTACFSLSHSLTPVTDAPSRCSYLPGGSSPHRDDHVSALSLKAFLMTSFRRRCFGRGCLRTLRQ